MKIAIVAGELSGDMIGAGLVRELKQHFPDAVFSGIGGPQIQAAAGEFNVVCPLELLSVMGLVDVLKRYPALRRCFKRLSQTFLDNPPDIFIGVDAPDFNLRLERVLKQAGIPTLHYVSPTVWAWREYRMKKIIASCDWMLTLFPFEASYYEKQGHPVTFTGHPLAQQIPLRNPPEPARESLGLPLQGQYIALLPGSRQGEVSRLTRPFLETALLLLKQKPNLRFLVPLANAKMRQIFQEQAGDLLTKLPLELLDGQARTAMTAADAILLASGTATLEAALIKRPMVIAYKLSALTWLLASRLVKVPWVGQPNLLAGKKIVPEFLQKEATAENMSAALLAYFTQPETATLLTAHFDAIHQQLKQPADERAATAVLQLLAQYSK
ncbi:lipid-A-disaccharide synthase [Candidatus Venteria ishoeyi]|uniref:lipid-A-disaccharide synthase n=1 Tax=Candidatus Venteria ishoeyi TaxID=1899563 RepID=UPI0025A59E5B|nr:lipid-A-disaccharide synthase [Candidatus Venteria ishoeyi]MDM8546401.1 lipid-A-disaccharide synthase [Candidatus Venteria ishoeyi]